MLQYLAANLSGPTRRQLGRRVKCVACRGGAIRYVWLWGSDVAVTLCGDQSPAHLAIKAAEERPADFDFLANVAMTLAALNQHAADHRPGGGS